MNKLYAGNFIRKIVVNELCSTIYFKIAGKLRDSAVDVKFLKSVNLPCSMPQ